MGAVEGGEGEVMPTPKVPNVEIMTLEEAIERYGLLSRQYGQHLRRPEADFVESLKENQVAVFTPCPGPHHTGKKGQWACTFTTLLRSRQVRAKGTYGLGIVHKETVIVVVKLPSTVKAGK